MLHRLSCLIQLVIDSEEGIVPLKTFANAGCSRRNCFPVSIQIENVVLDQSRHHAAGGITESILSAAQRQIDTAVEFLQGNIAVSGPMPAQVVIETEVYQYARVASQPGGKLASQFCNQWVSVGIGIDGAMQFYAALQFAGELPA